MSNGQVCRLPKLGVIRFSGADALAFLHGQVTADLNSLQDGESLPAAWCSPQGRVIALMRIGRRGQELLAVLPRELCATVVEGLRRYVMRSRVQIEDASPRCQVAGVIFTATSDAPLTAARDDMVCWTLPGSRLLRVGEPDATDTGLSTLAIADESAWEWRCIEQGEPEIYTATSGTWVPQMLNLDLLGAVSFSKGCYPGQEVVARTQHLGRIKRRLFRYGVAGDKPAAGTGLLDGGNRVGEVVRVASHGGKTLLLAVVNLDAAGRELADVAGAARCRPIDDAPGT